ncbi:type A2 lantipeptide [Streptomyces sp. NPDC093707]|uniref:type A2 lantipeptide n=1 Tax=Streptomyces sp. NPDC093707 TaxID=3154984 RepID=UPI00344D52C9
MNNAQIQTQEISDADLDNVSGGLVGEVVNAVTTAAGSVSPAAGALQTATGTVHQATGLDATGVAGNLTNGL